MLVQNLHYKMSVVVTLIRFHALKGSTIKVIVFGLVEFVIMMTVLLCQILILHLHSVN